MASIANLARMGTVVAAGAVVTLLWLERRYPLRHDKPESDGRRVPRNIAIAATTGAVINLCERPVIEPLVRWGEQKGVGLLPLLGLRPVPEAVLGLLLMDYTLYWWHILLHRMPFLWRSHRVHHIDLVLDASTAIRFHGLEFLASIPWRVAQVLIFGIRPKTLSLWQRLTMMEVMFHHANLRLPVEFEKRLSRIVMTPRLHGIHHSVVADEMNTNFSSGLTVWDVLHGTLKTDVPQDRIEIGVPERHGPDDVRLGRLLALPFERSGSD